MEQRNQDMVAFSQTNVAKVQPTVSFHIISLLLSKTRREVELDPTLCRAILCLATLQLKYYAKFSVVLILHKKPHMQIVCTCKQYLHSFIIKQLKKFAKKF